MAIERENLRPGFDSHAEDLWPDPARAQSVRAVRAALSPAQPGLDHDQAWFIQEPNGQWGQDYAEFCSVLAAAGFEQVWRPGYGRVWRKA